MLAINLLRFLCCITVCDYYVLSLQLLHYSKTCFTILDQDKDELHSHKADMTDPAVILLPVNTHTITD